LLSAIATHEAILRLLIFITALVTLVIAEIFAPKREPTVNKGRRWFGNFSLVIVSSFLLRFLSPFAPVAAALYASDHNIGLFNGLAWPKAAIWLVCFLGLDLIIYWQHRMFHRLAWCWRFHQVHHADLDIDVTTAVRFHPFELVLSSVIKSVAVLGLGAPVDLVIVFEIVLNAAAMFNHANLALPTGLDRVLRWLVVTPDMHRVHHSAEWRETNSNYGFFLSWWDYVFHSYRAQPQLGHRDMAIGLEYLRNAEQCSALRSLLVMPLTSIAKQKPSG